MTSTQSVLPLLSRIFMSSVSQDEGTRNTGLRLIRDPGLLIPVGLLASETGQSSIKEFCRITMSQFNAPLMEYFMDPGNPLEECGTNGPGADHRLKCDIQGPHVEIRVVGIDVLGDAKSDNPALLDNA
jgi:hypothetical protein